MSKIAKKGQRWTDLSGLSDVERKEHVRALQRDGYARLAKVCREARAPDPLLSIEATDLAYIAGIIDGEGTICCMAHATGKTCYPSVSVSMTDFYVIEWIAQKWNATASKLRSRHPNYRPQLLVRLTGERALLVCKLLVPYLKVKRRQAELVQMFPMRGRVGPGVKISDTDLNDRRFALRDQINSLNLRPRNAAYRRGRAST